MMMELDSPKPFYDQESLLEYLSNNGISYEYHTHPAVYTNEQADLYTHDLSGFPAKNLFLTNHKGNHFYLLVTDANTKTDFKMLGDQLNESRIRFASEQKIIQLLGITPGSVTPLAVINDFGKKVEMIFDPVAWNAERIFCHPLKNTATLILQHSGLEKFLELTGHQPRIL